MTWGSRVSHTSSATSHQPHLEVDAIITQVSKSEEAMAAVYHLLITLFSLSVIYLTDFARIFNMASKARLNVQSFPRPPLLEKTPRHLQIKWNGETIADTKDAYWVLETHHPPTYYLPPSSLKVPLTKTSRRTWCEWKGAATYWALANPSNPSDEVANRIWSYEKPTGGFEPIKDFLSFYAGPWDCFVDGEKVEPQPGDFYGGWVTSDIDGIVKGKNGNWDPVI